MASFGIMSGYLLLLPVLVAQWVGVIGLRRAGKNGAWWSMLSGTVCSTVGPIASILIFILTTARLTGSSSGLGSLTTFAIAAGGLSMLGSLIFAIGFAMHGLRSARANERQGELEQLAADMSEEIARLRAGGPQA